MHVGQLVNMLRTPGVSALPGTVAIVAVKAAGSIAQQRPFFINKILPVLIGLASAQVGAQSCHAALLKTYGKNMTLQLLYFVHHDF